MGCLGELNIENRNIICATCNNKSGNDKNIAIDHKSESVLVSSIIGPIAPKISLASPSQPKPSLQPGVTIYKSTNGELAVKFESPEARKRFIDALGGPQQFANTDKFNAGKTCPAVYNNNNDTLYIPAYTAQNGELAASFPNNQMRDKFMNLLGMASAKLATTYPGQDALYIADKNIHQQGANIKAKLNLGPPSLPPQPTQASSLEKKVQPSGVTIYKSTNGELAVKFESPEARKEFIDALGGPQQFAITNKFNAGKTCPAVYNNNNDTLYIPAYTAQNGELAASFPNNQMRDKFMNLLGMASAKLATTYPGQDALYIADKNIHQQGANIKLSISMATPQNQTTHQPAPTTGSGFFTAFNNGSNNSNQFADFAAKASALDEKLKTAKPESIAKAEASAIAQEINDVTNTHKAISTKTNPPFEAKSGKIMNCLESIAKRAQDFGGAIAKAGIILAKSLGLNISKDEKVQKNPPKKT